MRTFVGSVALIRRHEEEKTYWLSQWNYEWQRYHFVGGERGEGETYREALIRHLANQLNLQVHRGFLVSSGPRAHLEFSSDAEHPQEQTFYLIELFEVHLRGAEASAQVETDQRTRWLSNQEIQTGRCEDGVPVSPLMNLVLSRADLLASWE